MKKIDTWLDIQNFVERASRVPDLPIESTEFRMLGLSALADVRVVRRYVSARDNV